MSSPTPVFTRGWRTLTPCGTCLLGSRPGPAPRCSRVPGSASARELGTRPAGGHSPAWRVPQGTEGVGDMGAWGRGLRRREGKERCREEGRKKDEHPAEAPSGCGPGKEETRRPRITEPRIWGLASIPTPALPVTASHADSLSPPATHARHHTRWDPPLLLQEGPHPPAPILAQTPPPVRARSTIRVGGQGRDAASCVPPWPCVHSETTLDPKPVQTMVNGTPGLGEATGEVCGCPLPASHPLLSVPRQSPASGSQVALSGFWAQ